MATEPKTPAKTVKPAMKSITVSIPESVHAFLDEKQWETRTKLSHIVRDGVIEKAVALGYVPENVG